MSDIAAFLHLPNVYISPDTLALKSAAMAGLLSDIRFALRQLRKARSFTFTVVLPLAVCMALNATILAIVDAIVFKPLAYPQPDRLGDLVTTYTTPRRSGFEDSQDGLVWQI